MIFDAQNLFSNKQAVTTTAVSQNTIDLGKPRDIGPGEPVNITAAVTTDFAGGTSITFDLIVSDNADLSSPVVLQSNGPVLLANLKAGQKFPLRAMIPVNPDRPKRYLGLRYTVAGTMTAGAITAGIVRDLQAADAYNASGLYMAGV